MLLTILFSILYLGTEEAKYQEPMKKSAEAFYSNSEAKQIVDSVTDKAKTEYPVLTAIAPVGYAVGVKKQFRVRSATVSIPNTTTTYQYDHNSRSGSVAVEWRF